MKTSAIPLMMALALVVGSFAAGASEPTRCDQIQWPDSVLERYPDADKACRAVIVRDGVRYVKFTARFVRTDADGNVFVKVRLPDGSTGPRAFKAPQYLDVQSETSRSSYDFRELERGEILDVFIPVTSWSDAGRA